MKKLIPFIFLSCFACANVAKNLWYDLLESDSDSDYTRLKNSYPKRVSLRTDKNDYFSGTERVYQYCPRRQAHAKRYSDDNEKKFRTFLFDKVKKSTLNFLTREADTIKDICNHEGDDQDWKDILKSIKCLMECLPDQFVQKSLVGKELLNYIADKIIYITRNSDIYEFEQIAKTSQCVGKCVASYVQNNEPQHEPEHESPY